MLKEINIKDKAIVAIKNIKKEAKTQELNQLKNVWEQKPLHGRYTQRIRNADMDIAKTNQWLKSTGLKMEAEGLIIAVKDLGLPTRNYQANIIKKLRSNPICRVCAQKTESIDHFVYGCPILTPIEYIERHVKIGHYIHWKVCKYYGILDKQSTIF